MKESLAVWNVKPERFPKKGNWENKIKFLVRYGILAPSGHNSQPWRFRIKGTKLVVGPDFERRRAVVDPNDRELFISLGAAAKNIEIAASYFGLIYEKKYNDLGIEFEFKDGEIISKNADLFKAITKRQTNRSEYKQKKIPSEKLATIDNDSLVIVSQDNEKDKLAELVYGSDIVWFQTKEITNELDRWLSLDIEGKAGSKLPGITMVAGNLLRAEDRAQKNKEMVKKAPIAIVIGSKDDMVVEWIKAGENYEELALKLTSMGLSHSFFNSIIEIESRREKLTKFCEDRIKPQLLIRVGWADSFPKHTPRRDVKEVLDIEN